MFHWVDPTQNLSVFFSYIYNEIFVTLSKFVILVIITKVILEKLNFTFVDNTVFLITGLKNM